MLAFIISTGVVLLAEMGDKTQLLAMAFCARYRPLQVIAGVTIATILNSLIAAALGGWLAGVSGVQAWIQGTASLSFLVFGLLALSGGGDEHRALGGFRLGAVATIALGFFIAELGDKTQLATVALAARFSGAFWGVAGGAVLGMLGANGLGVWVGAALCKRVSQRTINRVAAAAFIGFGLVSAFQVGITYLDLSFPIVLLATGMLGLAFGTAGWQVERRSQARGDLFPGPKKLKARPG